MKLNKKGFTLVELLAVIVILALLMVVAGRAIGGSLQNSKESAIKTEAAKLVGKTAEDIQSFQLDPTTYSKYTYASSTDITLGTPATLSDGNYTMIITVNANGSLGGFCIDDGSSLLYTGTIKNGNSVDNLTKGTWVSGGCTSVAG